MPHRGVVSPVHAASLALSLLPAEAWACATCSLREPESAVRSVLLVLGLMLTPFVVLGVGLWAVRRASREDTRKDPT
ncbi:hypothetical protein SAMN05443572_11465 [Myxococcus fulvus]|uniref:Lipoprotein n=1 Tax=Myxococcus fulvus TaxID=33 RepID=A0ABY1CVP5_MYXFU|nr:hypothetical protein SAMN05443572_11465 [Myxococcus fulvus]